MSRFIKEFLRQKGETGVYLAAFGKHPGWSDHMGLALENRSIALARSGLYDGAIGGNIDTGVWSRELVQESLDLLFVWHRFGRVLVGSIQPSRDSKGRDLYPFVLCAQLTPQPGQRIHIATCLRKLTEFSEIVRARHIEDRSANTETIAAELETLLSQWYTELKELALTPQPNEPIAELQQPDCLLAGAFTLRKTYRVSTSLSDPEDALHELHQKSEKAYPQSVPVLLVAPARKTDYVNVHIGAPTAASFKNLLGDEQPSRIQDFLVSDIQRNEIERFDFATDDASSVACWSEPVTSTPALLESGDVLGESVEEPASNGTKGKPLGLIIAIAAVVLLVAIGGIVFALFPGGEPETQEEAEVTLDNPVWS